MAQKRLTIRRNFNQKNINDVPEQSGVYVITSKRGICQWVGMAGPGRLRERLQEHLRENDVKAADLFQFRPTSSEAEARMREEEYKGRLKPKQGER